MGFLYDAAFLGYAALYAPVFVAKGKHREGMDERRGFVPEEIRERLKDKNVLWIHAVSVGEVRLAARLIRLFGEKEPCAAVVLTTITASGKRVARDLCGDRAEVLYLPFDWSPAVRRFLDAVRPRVAVFLETEIWPNVLEALWRGRVPAVWANARISDRSLRLYRWAAPFLKTTLERITVCLAQSVEHCRRFSAIGLSAEKIRVTGNMKFDLELPEPRGEFLEPMENFRRSGGPVVLGASTHAGEDAVILDAVRSLRRSHAQARLVLAPRHLERLEEVERCVRHCGEEPLRLSDARGTGVLSGRNVLVVDAWGILNQLYAYADAVVMGGSFVNHGGHNIAEAAVAGRPVIHGPHMENFKDMQEEFRREDAAVAVSDAQGLAAALERLFEDKDFGRNLGDKAKSVVLKNRGATARNVEEIEKWFSKKS